MYRKEIFILKIDTRKREGNKEVIWNRKIEWKIWKGNVDTALETDNEKERTSCKKWLRKKRIKMI